MLFAVLVEVLLRSGNDSSSSLLPSTAASKVASKKAERERECGKRGDRERERRRGEESSGVVGLFRRHRYQHSLSREDKITVW